MAKLVARARAGSRLTEAEVRERVRQWVAALCGVALAMWGRGCFVALAETAEQLLRERAIQLMLPYTDCFSVFLVRRSGPGPKHSFLHHTQQSVLAAQHLHTLLLQDLTAQELRALLLPGPPTTSTTDTTNTTTDTTTMHNTTDTTNTTTSTTPTTTATLTASLAAVTITTAANTTTLDHFLDILVDAAASLAAMESLSEGRAKVLAELLEQCRHCPWLEVVRCTACCPTMAREVRPHLTEEWKVTDAHVQASAVLADIRAPASITIELHDKSDNLPHLLPLLHCLAKAHVQVHLLNLCNLYSILATNSLPSTCDSLLLPLCGPASLCSLINFSGVLSAEGYRALRHQRHNLVLLAGGVLDLTALEELIQLTHHTERLQEVTIVVFSIFRALPSKSVSPRVGAHLRLMCVEDKEAEDAVILARHIKHTFKSIRLRQVSPSAVCRMVKAFRKDRVRTLSLGAIGLIEIFGILQCVFPHCFPLPLPTNMTLRDVYRMWDKMELEVTMEVKVQRHSKDTGTAADTEDSCSGAESGDVAGP